MDIFNYNFFEPINTKSDINELFLEMAKKAMGFPMVKQSAEFYYPFIENIYNVLNFLFFYIDI